MTASTESMLLAAVDRLEKNIIKLVSDVGEIKGQLKAKDSACQVCNNENKAEHDGLHARLTDSVTWQSAKDALEANKEKTEAKNETHSVNNWQKLYYGVLAFASIGGLVAGIKAIREWLGSVIK